MVPETTSRTRRCYRGLKQHLTTRDVPVTHEGEKHPQKSLLNPQVQHLQSAGEAQELPGRWKNQFAS